MKKTTRFTAVATLALLFGQTATPVLLPQSAVVQATPVYKAVKNGATITVTATNALPNANVEILDDIGDVNYANTRTDAKGSFTVTLKQPLEVGTTITVWVGAEKGVETIIEGATATSTPTPQPSKPSTTNGGGQPTQPSTSGALVLTRYVPNETYVLATGSEVGVTVQVKTLAGEVLGKAVITDTSRIEVTLNRGLNYDEILVIEEITPSGKIKNIGYSTTKPQPSTTTTVTTTTPTTTEVTTTATNVKEETSTTRHETSAQEETTTTRFENSTQEETSTTRYEDSSQEVSTTVATNETTEQKEETKSTNKTNVDKTSKKQTNKNDLPKTGSQNAVMMSIFGLLAIGAAFVLVVLKKRSKK